MHSLALVGCAIAILAWGAGGIFDKLAFREIGDPFGAVMVRMLFATSAVVGSCLATGRARAALDYSPRTYLFLAMTGLLGGFIGQVASYVAIKHAPVSQVVPITATYPVVAFLLAVLFLREELTAAKLLGVALVVAGLVLVSGARNDRHQNSTQQDGAVSHPTVASASDDTRPPLSS